VPLELLTEHPRAERLCPRPRIYDAFGNRLEKDVWTQASGTTTVSRFAYDGQNVWADVNGSNALQTRYLRGDMVDQLFARVVSAGTAAWYL